MSNVTYSSRTPLYRDTSTLGKLLVELIAATPLYIFVSGIKAAMKQSQR